MYEEQRKEIEQICPSHADHIGYYKDAFIDGLFQEGEVVAQRKYDGERMLVHFLNGQVYCTSRRISVKTGKYQENQQRIADLKPIDPSFGYTVIDCECYGKNWSEIASVLHSLPERALELQKSITLKFAVFDVLFIDGVDMRPAKYSERLKWAEFFLARFIKDERFHIAETMTVSSRQEAFAAAEQQWQQGNEGVVIKSLAKAYYDKGAMLKIKRFETVDVVIYGYQLGTGKNSNVVGALLVGYYDPESDSIKHISRVNCGTDADRKYWKETFDNATEPVRRVLEVKCQEITGKSLRHPAYIRVRDDKSYKMCTKETIFKEEM